MMEYVMNSVLMQDLYKYRFLSSLEFSPDGGKAAFVVSVCDKEENGYKSDLYLLADGGAKRLTQGGKTGTYYWEDERNLVFAACRTEKEKQHGKDGDPFTAFYRIDVTGGEAAPAFSLPVSAGSVKLLPDGRLLVLGDVNVLYPDLHLAKDEERKKILEEIKKEKDYEVIDESPWWLNGAGLIAKHRTGIYLYDPQTEELIRITEPFTNVDDVAVLDGKVYFTCDDISIRHDKRNELRVYDPETGETKTILGKENAIWTIQPMKTKLFMAASKMERHGTHEHPVFYVLDPASGNMEPLCSPDHDFGCAFLTDVLYGGGHALRADGGFLYYVMTDRTVTQIRRIDEEGHIETLYRTEGLLTDLAVKNGRILFGEMHGMDLTEIYELTESAAPEPAASAMTAKQLTGLNRDALADTYVAQPQYLSCKSEGWEIDGWVLLPKDYDPAKTYPAVLDIHGGPKCAYGPVFFHEMQVWAGMGYFVFFCNPFGGDGRGDEFADIRGKYGTTDYRNVMDFTDAVLAKYPQIDKARVCVTGGSYGGFMTNWIVSHTDRFVCAATQRSIANWFSMYGISDIGPVFTKDQADADIFEPEDQKKIWEMSPLKHAKNVKTPLLFIHSDEDYRCPIAEAYQFYTALVERGVPARLVVFHGENHGLSRGGKPEHRIRRLAEITNWFEKYVR